MFLDYQLDDQRLKLARTLNIVVVLGCDSNFTLLDPKAADSSLRALFGGV